MAAVFKVLHGRGVVWASLMAAMGLMPPVAIVVMDKLSDERPPQSEFRSIHDCIESGGLATWDSKANDFRCKLP
jgi:hypothetical protein